MRGTLFMSILAAATLVAHPATAQSKELTGSLGGGVTFPLGDATNLYKTGLNGTATLGYHPQKAKLGVSFEADIHQLQQITLPADNLGKVYANIWMFMGRLDYNLTPKWYLTGGAGLVREEHRIRFYNTALKTTASSTGFEGGIGVKLARRFFAEGRVIYTTKKPNATILVPLTIGLRF